MIYQAAVSESFEGEAKHFNCSTLVIEKGDYLTERVADWKSRKASIGLTFKKLTDAAYDTTFPCIEWYQHNDVLCMIKIVIN